MKNPTKKEMLNVLLDGRPNKQKEVNKCYRYVDLELVKRYYENGDKSTFIRIALGSICANY